MALKCVGDIEDEFVAAGGAADLQRKGRAGRLQPARDRDARMTGQGQRIGRREPGEVTRQLLPVYLLDVELLEREGRHRDGRADQDVDVLEKILEGAVDPRL